MIAGKEHDQDTEAFTYKLKMLVLTGNPLSDAEKKIEKLLKKRTADGSAEFETRNMDLFNESES